MKDLTNLIEWTEFAADGKTVLEVLTILNNRHWELVGNLERERDERQSELEAMRATMIATEAYQAGLAADNEAMREAIGVAVEAINDSP